MRCLAIIPARSGSKGLPDKNIINMHGHPLIYYTIAAAMESKCFDEVMVSTDSQHYAEIAQNCGAKVPFLRSEKMSSDTAGSWDVVREVIHNYREKKIVFDYIALLQPTSPLRSAEDIRRAFKLLEREEVKNVVSVTETEHPVQWCFELPLDGCMKKATETEEFYKRRQDLKQHYRENGAIYIVDAKKIMDNEYNLYQDGCYAYVMDRERSLDIDETMDLLMCKCIMEDNKKGKSDAK